jgi:hypothetical protein
MSIVDIDFETIYLAGIQSLNEIKLEHDDDDDDNDYYYYYYYYYLSFTNVLVYQHRANNRTSAKYAN